MVALNLPLRHPIGSSKLAIWKKESARRSEWIDGIICPPTPRRRVMLRFTIFGFGKLVLTDEELSYITITFLWFISVSSRVLIEEEKHM
jgi:hypothetical protein